MEIITVKNLSFRYPGQQKTALEEIDVSFRRGEFVLLCGETGCGKTTLLRHIKRELTPHGERTGEIFFEDKPLDSLSDREAAGRIGFVMQRTEQQIVTDKVWHELAFGLESLGVPTPAIRRQVGEMASYFGIQSWFRKKTAELSGGQKQLLNLASVMVMQPDVLILDEPTSQLDPIAAADFIATLQKLNRELGLTILLTEHRLEEVFPVADRVVVMGQGKILLSGTPEQVGSSLPKVAGGEALLRGLPSAVRIYSGLGLDGQCPLTVREGREFLSQHCGNSIRSLEQAAGQEPAEEAVTARDLWFRYERPLPDVLRGVSFTVKKGEIYALLGGNGTGKSTVLSVISGQRRAYKGQVCINGRKIGNYKGSELYRHNVALLPQNPQDVFLKPTLREDYAEIIKSMDYTKEQGETLLGGITARLGLEALMEVHPYDLSGGEQQKAALAKILLLQPKIILLDEPTKGIDARAKGELGQILRELKDKGLSVMMVTHDVEFAAEHADRCAMLFDGEILSEDEPRVFFSDNRFYTTAASRISRHMYDYAVTCRDVVALGKRNGGANEKTVD